MPSSDWLGRIDHLCPYHIKKKLAAAFFIAHAKNTDGFSRQMNWQFSSFPA
jgi:hypothetical protein